MKPFRHYFFALVLVSATATPVLASVTYEYTGPTFQIISGDMSTSNHLMIDLTTPLPLSSYSVVQVDPVLQYLDISWTNLTISDGLTTLYSTSADSEASAWIYNLDNLGLPSEWAIGDQGYNDQMFSCYVFQSIDDFRDESIHVDSGTYGGVYPQPFGWVEKGTWSIIQTAPVPELATLFLLATGMAGLAVTCFRMKKH